MDWINCNLCYAQPVCENDITRFSLTSCGHIFCESCGCFALGTADCCKLCKNECSSTVIGGEIFQANQQVLEYFQEPEQLCKKMLQVLKFQKTHRNLLVGHHQRVLSKYNKAKLYIKKLENELRIKNTALRNSSQTPCNGSAENQLYMSTPIYHPYSAPFKMTGTKLKPQYTQNMNHATPDMRHRKQLFQNELSLLFMGSNGSEIHTPGSSLNTSQKQENCDVTQISKMENLQLNSFGNRQFKKR